MASPTVQEMIEWAELAQTTSVDATMPSVTNVGDLLLIVMGCGETQDFVDEPAEWTQLAFTSIAPMTAVFAKISDGTEAGSSVQFICEEPARWCGYTFRITNWLGNIASGIFLDVAFGTSNSPNPPSVSNGSSEDRLAIAWYVYAVGSVTASAYPTNFSDNQDFNTAGTGTSCSVGIATRQFTGNSIDPGTFTASTSNTWESATIMIRPNASSPVNQSLALATTTAEMLAAKAKIVCLMGSMSASAGELALNAISAATGARTQVMGLMSASAEMYANIVNVEEEEVIFNISNIKVYYFKLYTNYHTSESASFFDSGTFDGGLFDGAGGSPSGDGTFIDLWPSTIIPSYSWPINGRQTSLTYILPRKFGQAGERGELNDLDEDLVLGYYLESVVVDREEPYGVIVHSGRIEEYTISDPAADGIAITIMPNASNFMDHFVFGPIEFVDEDPTNMFLYFLNNGYLPGLTWDNSNPLVGQKFTITFEKQRVGDIVDQIRQISGANWFWRVNPDNTVTYNKWSLKSATHSIAGSNVSVINYVRSKIDTKYRVFLFGAEARDEFGFLLDRIYAVATEPGYDPTVNPRDLFYTDSRITDTGTAERIANALLEFHKRELIETEIEIIDSNQDVEHGYDIETIKPGDTLEVFNPQATYNRTRWGQFDYGTEPWGNEYAGLVQGPLVVAEINYLGRSIKVKLTNRPAAFVEELVNLDNKILLEGSV